MARAARKFCHACGARISRQKEAGIARDYCRRCGIFFYDNPLPVVSSILVMDRRVLLVKRANPPYRGKWCLPSGFAETGESVTEAALRELAEETGVTGRVGQLVDVSSCRNYYYGDLLFLTFEVLQVEGMPVAGDDAADIGFFPVDKVPRLAFPSNTKALAAYIESKRESWAILDSFALSSGEEEPARPGKSLLSDKLVQLIEENSVQIARLWLNEVRESPSTPTYHRFDPDLLFGRVDLVISHFGQWLAGAYHGQDIRTYYTTLGRVRRLEGFALSEVVSALSLVKKHIWEFALSRGMWSRTIDIYKILELERRVSLFFDKATHALVSGYTL